MIRVLIVDDEPLPRERIRSLLEKNSALEVIGECRNGLEAVTYIEEQRPDLVFLDIQMPEMNGIEVIRTLDERARPVIIFVTAFDQYAIEAFDVHALDYVLKPIQPQRFERALSRAIEMIHESRQPEFESNLRDLLSSYRPSTARRFVIRVGAKIHFVNQDDVDWIDAEANYMRLHVEGRVHLIRETMASLEERLSPDQFVRIHRSLMVNVQRIRVMEPHGHGEYLITMSDGARVTSSRTYLDRIQVLLRRQ